MPGSETQLGSTSADRRARVLTVLPDFPFPATTGLHLRMASNLDLVHRLGCYSALLYFSTEEREPLSVASTPLAQICDDVRHGGPRFPHKHFSAASLILHKLDFFLRGALGLPGSSYPFSMSYDRIGASDRIVAEAQRIEADFVILPSMFMHYTARLREFGFDVIIDAADVLTNLSASFLKNFNGRGGKLGLFANFLACRSQERIFLKECTELWATSAAEADAFSQIAPGVRVLVVPNSLDERVIQFAPPKSSSIVGFIGTYSYTPNLDAAQFLAKEVFPHVLAKCPDAILRIAGSGMTRESAAGLQRLKNVEVLGRVEDSGRFMDDCTVLALPVFIRGGVPLKLVEAMARGKAVVASPELVDKQNVSDGVDVLIRTGSVAFAEAVCSLLQNAEQRDSLGSAARRTFLKNWSLSRVEETLRLQSVLAHCARSEGSS